MTLNEKPIDPNKIPRSFWNYGHQIRVSVTSDLIKTTGNEMFVDFDEGIIKMQDLSLLSGGIVQEAQVRKFYECLSKIILNIFRKQHNLSLSFACLFGRCLHQLFVSADYTSMDPIIPRRFFVFGMPYDVYLSTKLDDNHGACLYELGILHVVYSQDRDVWMSRKTFFHEWVHIALDALDEDELSENETFIECIAKQITQFVRTAEYGD